MYYYHHRNCCCSSNNTRTDAVALGSSDCSMEYTSEKSCESSVFATGLGSLPGWYTKTPTASAQAAASTGAQTRAREGFASMR